MLAFQRMVGSPIPESPEQPCEQDILLLIRLLKEEVTELEEALHKGDDLNNLIKEITDVYTVVLMTAVFCGVNLDKAFDLTFRSHLSKLLDWQFKDGKLQKGQYYQEPDFTFMIPPADDFVPF